MNRKGFKEAILLSLSLIVILWISEDAVASSPSFDFNIQSHHLIIQVDPAQHFLKAEDRLEIQMKWGSPQILSFLLNPKLRITRIVDQKTGQPLQWYETNFSTHARRVDASLQEVEGSLLISISYEGPIYDPVVKEKGLQFIKGDQTIGLIGSEGVYLCSATHWYPTKPDSMAKFQIEAAIPEPFRIVTQGELISENLKGGHWSSKWVNRLPSESLTLVAGKYSVRRRGVGGIKLSTY